MKFLLVLLALALIGSSLVACGSGGRQGSSTAAQSNAAATGSTTSRTTSAVTPTLDYRKADRDKDNDGSIVDPDDGGKIADEASNTETFDFGHAADATDKQAVTTLLERYYAAALAEEGAKACSMMYITFAESVAEDYGHGSAGQPYASQGTTCPTVTALIYKHFHEQLATEVPLLKVARVRLVENHGLAVLSFGKLPERQIQIRKEGHAWKVGALLDGPLP